MHPRRWICLLLLFLVACNQVPALSSTPTFEATTTLAPVVPRTTSVPDPKATAREYLDAWKADDYATMYSLLTSISRDAISEEEFINHYRGVAIETTLQGLDYEILAHLTTPETAQVSYRVTLHSALVGEIRGDTVMNLSLEHGQWRVQWSDTLVLPQLEGGNYMKMDLQIPARANIYDRNGHALVAQTDATAIGVNTDQIDPEQFETLIAELSNLTGLRQDTIQGRIESAPPGYLQFGEVPAARVEQRFNVLSGLSGLVMVPSKWRFYFDGGIAPHLVGYVAPIPQEQLDEYLRRGYRQDERVGQTGLEQWGEQYLSGKRGGSLYVYNAQGQPVTKLAETPVQPAQAIYTTIDADFQLAVQQALGSFRGAAVVLERDTGRVLAMASTPGYDPNAFEPNNYNYLALLNDTASGAFLNRATQGAYPLGSVFKIITMAAGLESGLYRPETEYTCGYEFNEVAGLPPRYDWTWEHFQRDGRTQPSGTLTLVGALIRSCNPYFWHIGLDLYTQGLTTAISDMARGFGMGSRTGIEVVDEAAGNVPDPNSEVDAINLAIGQGDFLSTPLQVARFIAAIGNGGTLYRPQVVERIAPPDGEPTFVFQPEEQGKLPISVTTLQAIQEGMRGVVNSATPRGTAYHVFSGLNIPVAGKTGTAESGSGLPHAWFAGYTDAGRSDLPDIAVVVFIENIGEGSDYAAPVFRRIVELYFRGSPGKLYPWESTYNVTRTPTLEGGEEGTPEPGEEEDVDFDEGED